MPYGTSKSLYEITYKIVACFKQLLYIDLKNFVEIYARKDAVNISCPGHDAVNKIV